MSDIDDAWKTVQAHLKELAKAMREFRTVEVSTLETEFELAPVKAGEEQPLLPRVTLSAVGRDAAGAGGPVLKGFVTKIDMLHGDILQGQSAGLNSEDAKRLKEIHDKQVELGCKMFRDNITAIAETVGRLVDSDR